MTAILPPRPRHPALPRPPRITWHPHLHARGLIGLLITAFVTMCWLTIIMVVYLGWVAVVLFFGIVAGCREIAWRRTCKKIQKGPAANLATRE